MGNFFAELKRRHVYRVAAGYTVVTWVVLQLVNNVAPIMEAPAWVARIVLLLLVLGFPIAALLAWLFEATPDGLKRTAPQSKAQTKHHAADWILSGALAAVIAIFIYQQMDRPYAVPATRQASIAPGAANAGTISIAVLPFVNLSSDKEQEFFSDGMTEEITSALAKVPNLRVVARTSAFEFKGQNRDVQTIAQALHATHVIEGSVRKDGNQVRITAQLIKAGDGTHLWTESYDRELKGVFAVQEEIAQAIAGALRVPLGLKQGESLVSNRTNDVESYQQYLRARALFRARAVNQAVALLEPAVARDSDDPDALHIYGLMLASLGRVKQASSLREQLRTLEPFVPIYNILTAFTMQLNGQSEVTIPLLEAIPSGGAVNYFRNIYLAKAYAAAGRYGEAAGTLLAIPANTIAVSRRSVEDAARLLRSAPAKAGAPGTLPGLEHMGFVYAYAGAPNRLMEAPERLLEIGYATFSTAWAIWEPLNAPLRKTERFKAFVRKAGLVDYWRARGWPDLCRPVGADDFVCD